MHSTGSIYSIFSVANFSLSFLGWMQSTGQASTQAVSFVLIHGSAITWAIKLISLSFSEASYSKSEWNKDFIKNCAVAGRRAVVGVPLPDVDGPMQISYPAAPTGS